VDTTTPITAYYCVSTHWDREWYEPFQEFRMWLVETIDELIELMERRADFQHAHLDGQAILLEDYLAMRPENEDRLLKLVRAGRISVGPWYVLPDEWLISGESYVRNFLAARETCRRYGVTPMDFCYTPDQFGHIAALPMIARGAGLSAGIVWRGTADETHAPQFVWIGPDGSRLVTHKLFDEAAYGWLFHKTREIEGVRDYSKPSFREMIARMTAHERGRIRIPALLILDGNDHQRFRDDMIALFEGMRRDYPDFAWRWGSLEDYGQLMASHAEALPEYEGELREPSRAQDRACQFLIAHVVSSRYPIKYKNDQCQALLERWAEPCALFELMRGGAPVRRYLDEAWRYLLRNHPHDSICGCSIDQVHKDMQYRFDQARMLAEGSRRRSLAFLASPNPEFACPQSYVVHNPLLYPRQGIFELSLSFPPAWPERYSDGMPSAEPINKFEIVDAGGKKLPFQLGAIERGLLHKRLRPDARRETTGGDVYHVAVAMDLPGGGYAGFEVRPTRDAVRNFGTLRTGPRTADNGRFSFTLHGNGSASLFDPAGGRTYEGLFQYEDRGDCGDGWVWGSMVNERIFLTPGTRVTTGIEEEGPLRVVFRVEREFELPERLKTEGDEHERHGWRRSEQRASLRVVDLIYIEKNAPYIRVRTEVDNTVRDHRFRAVFPTYTKTDKSFAETPFAVVERDVTPPPESATWHERVNPEKAFTSFCGVQDDQGGLAVVAPFGLHEYEVAATPDRSIYLTLFRSTHKTVNTPGEPDGLLLGRMAFEYCLVPFVGRADYGMLARLAQEAQTGVELYPSAEAPSPVSLAALEGKGLVVTALKPAAEGAGGVIRIWNPGNEAREGRIRLDCTVTRAVLCNLLEVEGKELNLDASGAIPVQVEPRALCTVRFEWNAA
jgi:mannosylglycerate hydrolase